MCDVAVSITALQKTFPSDGSRSAVTVKVSRNDTCETLCNSIAAELDVAEARIILRDKREGDQS